MARFAFRNSVHSKILVIAVCAFACVCIQVPVATAQRVGGGAHPMRGGHMAPLPRSIPPPSARSTISHPRFITSRHPNFLGARFGFRPGLNNVFRRRLFFRGPFFRFEPGFAFNFFWSPNCSLYWVWGYSCSTGLPLYGYGYGFENFAMQSYETPVYLSAAAERDLVWLYRKDGAAYQVSDYWFVNGEVHFVAVDEAGAKSAEQTISAGDLNAQKTIDVNSRRGFRVVMRDEPIDAYLRDHPDATPPLLERPVND